jgi:hypothetical protein
MSIYNRDSTVPFWRSNVDVDFLFAAHAHRPDRAQAWLRHRYVSEFCAAFGQAVMMRGKFELGLLGAHTYHWTFTPDRKGGLALVLPVYEQGRLVDLLAIHRHQHHSVWGCVTGAGQTHTNVIELHPQAVQRFKENLEALADILVTKDALPDLELVGTFRSLVESVLSPPGKPGKNMRSASGDIWPASWMPKCRLYRW